MTVETLDPTAISEGLAGRTAQLGEMILDIQIPLPRGIDEVVCTESELEPTNRGDTIKEMGGLAVAKETTPMGEAVQDAANYLMRQAGTLVGMKDIRNNVPAVKALQGKQYTLFKLSFSTLRDSMIEGLAAQNVKARWTMSGERSGRQYALLVEGDYENVVLDVPIEKFEKKSKQIHTSDKRASDAPQKETADASKQAEADKPSQGSSTASGTALSFSLEEDDGSGILPWQEDALCAQTDPEAFFPEKGGSTREAKRICGRCDVRADCLEYALKGDERFGIWGGLSERERRRLKRRAG